MLQAGAACGNCLLSPVTCDQEALPHRSISKHSEAHLFVQLTTCNVPVRGEPIIRQ